TVTVASDRTAPVSSATVPPTFAPTDWPSAGSAMSHETSVTAMRIVMVHLAYIAVVSSNSTPSDPPGRYGYRLTVMKHRRPASTATVIRCCWPSPEYDWAPLVQAMSRSIGFGTAVFRIAWSTPSRGALISKRLHGALASQPDGSQIGSSSPTLMCTASPTAIGILMTGPFERLVGAGSTTAGGGLGLGAVGGVAPRQPASDTLQQ